jgi:hypothetical protein
VGAAEAPRGAPPVLERALASYLGTPESPWDDLLTQAGSYADCVVVAIEEAIAEGA